MRKTFVFVLILLSFLLSACNCKEVNKNIVLSEKIYTPSSYGICVKSGNNYIPLNGGKCFGHMELIPEKFVFVFSDGTSEKVSESEFNLSNVGDTFVVSSIQCGE